MQTEATEPRLPDFSSQDLIQATTCIVTSLEALREKYGLETILILTRGNAGQAPFSKVHASRKADRFLRDVVRMDVGILAQRIEGYAVSGTASPGATATALHGGLTKSSIKMKQKEQIKIARDLILNGLVNILREENVPEDKIPKSMNYKSYQSKIVEQCGVVLVGYPGEKGIVNPGELDALMLKELLLRLYDGRCYWERAPGHSSDVDPLPSPSSSSSWSSDSTCVAPYSNLSSTYEKGSSSHNSPQFSSMLAPTDSSPKPMSSPASSESKPRTPTSWPIKPESSSTPSFDYSSLDHRPRSFNSQITTVPTLSRPTHMVLRNSNFASSKPGSNNPILPGPSIKTNHSTPIPSSTITLSNTSLRSSSSTPPYDLSFHMPPLMLDDNQSGGSPQSFNLDLNLNFSQRQNYSTFQDSTDFGFSNDKASYGDFEMGDETITMLPNVSQDLFTSPSFGPIGSVGHSGPICPCSTIQSYAPWLSHAWDTPTPS